MLNIIIGVCVPVFPAQPFYGAMQASFFTLFIVFYYVDVKLNLLLMMLTFIIASYIRTTLELWEADTEYIRDRIFVAMLIWFGFFIITSFIGRNAQLNKKLRVQMTEYFNLMNRMHEGIIVLKNSQ